MKNNLPNLALAILRIGASAMLLTHGIPKIERLFADTITFPDPLGVGASTSLTLAIIGEVIAPIFILVGFRTKFAAILSMITMLVAVLIHHSGDPFADKEKALLFALMFLVIFLAGPGKYSIDKR
ncbi:MAG: DoxX family protein [Flavobacteriaceae bacterium]|nr:DoxX family protein [Flavobacteriaceae bacterium]